MHTQGPLEIDLGAMPSIVVVGADLGDIAEFFSREEHSVGVPHEEALANARLFIAAPRMRLLLANLIGALAAHVGQMEPLLQEARAIQAILGEPLR